MYIFTMTQWVPKCFEIPGAHTQQVVRVYREFHVSLGFAPIFEVTAVLQQLQVPNHIALNQDAENCLLINPFK